MSRMTVGEWAHQRARLPISRRPGSPSTGSHRAPPTVLCWYLLALGLAIGLGIALGQFHAQRAAAARTLATAFSDGTAHDAFGKPQAASYTICMRMQSTLPDERGGHGS